MIIATIDRINGPYPLGCSDASLDACASAASDMNSQYISQVGSQCAEWKYNSNESIQASQCCKYTCSFDLRTDRSYIIGLGA